MKTVNETRAECRNSAHKTISALDYLIEKGYGDYPCFTYSGTAYAVHKCSNAYKTKARLISMGYVCVAECAGPRAGRRKTEGHVVYMALEKY